MVTRYFFFYTQRKMRITSLFESLTRLHNGKRILGIDSNTPVTRRPTHFSELLSLSQINHELQAILAFMDLYVLYYQIIIMGTIGND